MFKTIAEIGCSHIGCINRAKELAKLAKLSGADILKTQKRNPLESVKKELWDKPHPNKLFAYGKTYLEHRQNVELSIEKHIELENFCNEIGIAYSTSVWDMTSAKEVIKHLNLNLIKIPSALNLNFTLIKYLVDHFKGEIHISTGMINKEEKIKLFEQLEPFKYKFVIYHCTSGYPVPFENIHILEIKNLKNIFPRIGFSNHGYGIALEPVALSLGATYFERHFIDDRLFPHNDSAGSLEPQGFSKMVRDLKAVDKSLTYKPDQLEQIEIEQRDKLQFK